jgi:hypothetical protein
MQISNYFEHRKEFVITRGGEKLMIPLVEEAKGLADALLAFEPQNVTEGLEDILPDDVLFQRDQEMLSMPLPTHVRILTYNPRLHRLRPSSCLKNTAQ